MDSTTSTPCCQGSRRDNNHRTPPFTHTPSYVKQTGWVFHTIQLPFKKDKHGLPTTTSSGRGGVLLAIKQDTFAVTQKTHYEQDQYQAATWTLKAGIFIPHIRITGMYISPDPLLPNGEIKQLYATLNTHFHPPSPPSSQNTHADHYHIYTGDFNSWTGIALEDHLAHPPSLITSRVGDPRPDHQPQDSTPNPQTCTTNPKARGRLLLDFLNPHSLIIGNGSS